MSAFADSPEEALDEMRAAFAERKASGEPLPGPGVCPPIEQTSAPRMAEHPKLADDFFRRILNLDYGQYWVSDEARLGDFHDDETNERNVERILLAYGVDVSDIADGPLVAILERIVARGTWPK